MGNETVTARIEGEHLGSADLQADGHYDEDGTPDRAFFRHTHTGRYELVVHLSTVAEAFVLAELAAMTNFGVRTVPPGTYETACAKGHRGVSCIGEEEAELRLDRDGVLLFQYESTARLFYLKRGSFANTYLSD